MEDNFHVCDSRPKPLNICRFVLYAINEQYDQWGDATGKYVSTNYSFV
jgi:hypothetical protein